MRHTDAEIEEAARRFGALADELDPATAAAVTVQLSTRWSGGQSERRSGEFRIWHAIPDPAGSGGRTTPTGGPVARV